MGEDIIAIGVISKDNNFDIQKYWNITVDTFEDECELIKFIEAAINAYEDWKIDGE